MFRIVLTLALFAPAFTLAAPDSDLLFGGDYFAAGNRVETALTGANDVFLAGEYAKVTTPVQGSVHAMARNVRIDASVAGNLYAAGQDVLITQAVAGNASLGGYTIEINNDIGGNLRASGTNLTLKGTVAGTAIMTAKNLHILGTIEGDALLNARNITFGPNAQINGQVTLYDHDSSEIPSSVAPKDRITLKTDAEWDRDDHAMPWGFTGFLGGIGIGIGIIVLVAAIALAFSKIAPTATAKISELGKGSIGRSWWIGFLTISALIGAAIVLAMTIIGMLATPVIAVIVLLTALAGLVAGAYGFGAKLTQLAGRNAALSEVAVLRDTLTGIIAAALFLLVPFVGWFALWVLVLFGIGLLSRWLFQPSLSNKGNAPDGDVS